MRRGDGVTRQWTFLSTHGLVLLAIAENPSATQREIARMVGVTEKTIQNAISDMVNAGHLTRIKEGRRNRYELNPRASLRHGLVSRSAQIRDLIKLMPRD